MRLLSKEYSFLLRKITQLAGILVLCDRLMKYFYKIVVFEYFLPRKLQNDLQFNDNYVS